ncbi:hypothetical protein OPV22_009437 [Ensete ventricosum]|uniref:THH1/TOM1/TOM3 domain-containing protein n=1 Tax=Ensete ventricosum TaxID=4639 RepID=A0AAV8RB02_ENSVE|nr:hypothetical protein OPV22_009437 [Ensete ventricosum]
MSTKGIRIKFVDKLYQTCNSDTAGNRGALPQKTSPVQSSFRRVVRARCFHHYEYGTLFWICLLLAFSAEIGWGGAEDNDEAAAAALSFVSCAYMLVFLPSVVAIFVSVEFR